MRCLDGITDWMDIEFVQAPGSGDGHGNLLCCSSWGRRVGHDWATKLNWLHCMFRIGTFLVWKLYLNKDILKKKKVCVRVKSLCVKMTSCIPDKPVSITWVPKWRHMWRRAAGKHNGHEPENNLCCCEPPRFRKKKLFYFIFQESYFIIA